MSSAIFSCQGSREEPGDKLTRLACLGVAGGERGRITLAKSRDFIVFSRTPGFFVWLTRYPSTSLNVSTKNKAAVQPRSGH